MKKIKFILMVMFIPLLTSCIKALIAWDCEDDNVESYIYFENADEYGLELIGVSLYRDSLNYPYIPISLKDNPTFGMIGWKGTGVEVLRGVERYHTNENNGSRGEHFLLFMDHDENVLLVWDLRDTTQRWADESLWTMDSTFKEVECGSGMQIRYRNTYIFSEEDFATQK